MAKQYPVEIWGGHTDRRCGLCHKKLQKGDKYVLMVPKGADKAQRRHYPRCAKKA